MIANIFSEFIHFPKGAVLIIASCLHVLGFGFMLYKNYNNIHSTIRLVFLSLVVSTWFWILINSYFEFPSLVTHLGETFAYTMFVAAGISYMFSVTFIYVLSCLLKNSTNSLKQYQRLIAYGIIVLSIGANLPNLSIKSVFIEPPGIALAEYNTVGELGFYVLAVLGIILTAFNLFSGNFNQRKFSAIRKTGARFIAVGILITHASVIIFHMILPLFFQIYSTAFLPPLISIFSIFLLEYGIFTFRFKSIKLLINRIFKKALTFFISFGFSYPFLYYSIETYGYEKLLIHSFLSSFIFLITFFLISKILNSNPVHHFTQWSPTQFFIKSLETFCKENNFHKGELIELEKKIKQLFEVKLSIQNPKIVLFKSKSFHRYKKLQSLVIKNPEIIVKNELFIRNKKDFNLCQSVEENAEVFLPIHHPNRELLGFLVLGEKMNQEIFYEEEIERLIRLKIHLDTMISNSVYNLELEKKIKIKTKALRQKNEQLKESYEQLQHLDNVKDEFLSIASHELRTPLSIIKGYTDFLRLRDFGPLTNKQSGFVEKIFKNTNNLIQLINRMLDISRLESGKMEFYPVEINMTKFIKTTQQEFKIIYANKNLQLTFSNPNRLKPIVFLDPEKLNIIFTNLLGNAYKFTPEGRKVCITLELAKEKKHLKITIKDQGVGIPKEKLELIFNKFQQAENSLQKSYAGTGLGLNITRQIVEKFGGTIWAESEDKIKTGSAFIFILPYISQK